MSKFLLALFSSSSEVSTMRVMSVFALVVAAVISIIGIYRGIDLSELATLAGVLVGAAFGGKAMQKFAEVKSENTDEEEH